MTVSFPNRPVTVGRGWKHWREEPRERRLRTSHPVSTAQQQPDTSGNHSCPRHWRTPRPRFFPAREKVLGLAFLPAQALTGDKAGFGAKGRILPDRGQGCCSGSVLLQGSATRLDPAGARRLLEGEQSSDAAGPRGALALSVTHFPVGFPSTPCPCSWCIRSAQACLGTVQAGPRCRPRGAAGSFCPSRPLHSPSNLT